MDTPSEATRGSARCSGGFRFAFDLARGGGDARVELSRLEAAVSGADKQERLVAHLLGPRA
jgi:hypothetical protein